MYKSFFNLARNPFDLTPDPTCFVPTPRHNEALAALYYGVRRHKGVVVVTGEVGTGKTLLLRCLLRLFKESEEIAYAYLFNCRLSPLEFLYYTLTDFGVPSAGKNKSKLLLDLSRFVTSRGLKGLTTVLIVDEAHNLSNELLEEIRLLSNLETNDDKLLQIVLVGQPELDEKLDSFDLRPLKQRIALRAHLGPLDSEEVTRYVEERLRIAGADLNSNPLFSTETISSVCRHSRGFPRLINTICENALITAYARQLPAVTPEIIKEVSEELRLDIEFSPNGKKFGNHDNLDAERARSLLLDLYASLRGSPTDHSGLVASIAHETSEHEPNI